MVFEQRFLVGLAAVSVATASSLYLPQSAPAQGGLLQRVQERREAREQQNSSQQQNSAQQQNLQQQPMQQQAMQQRMLQQPARASDVSMVTLQAQPGPGGSSMVVTPKGMVVPLPGAGVNGDVAHIYMGSQGGFWYTDKNNQQVDLTPAVRMMQANAQQSQAAVAVPQYAPAPQNYGQYNGGGAATAATAAGLGVVAGAATGAAIASANSGWGTVPYGTPVRYGAGAVPYYNQGGKPIYINASNTANINNVNAYHATGMAQQQAWYNHQQVDNATAWKGWQQPTANPFVASQYAGGGAAMYGAAEGQQAARYGAAEGATAAHYGAQEGQQAARDGAAEGASAAHYGAQEGQQAARTGAAEGASAAHYGSEQGQQAARMGAAEGASADHRGNEEGQQARRFGAAEGARGADADGRAGRFGGRGADGADRGELGRRGRGR